MDYVASWVPFVQRTSNDLLRVNPTVGDYSWGPLPWQPTESSQVTSQATFAKMNQTLFLRINVTQQHGAGASTSPRFCRSPLCLSVPLWMPSVAYVYVDSWQGEMFSSTEQLRQSGLPSSPHFTSSSISTAAWEASFILPRGKKTGRSTFSWGSAIPGLYDLVENRTSLR